MSLFCVPLTIFVHSIAYLRVKMQALSPVGLYEKTMLYIIGVTGVTSVTENFLHYMAALYYVTLTLLKV